MAYDSVGHPEPLSSGTPDDPAGNPPADLTGTGRKPPRWWTLPVPVLLTLPVSAWCVLIAAISSLCLDTCEPANHPLTAIGVTEFFLAVATVVLLIVGLAVRTWRRALRLVLWNACVLAWLGGAYVLTWASNHP